MNADGGTILANCPKKRWVLCSLCTLEYGARGTQGAVAAHWLVPPRRDAVKHDGSTRALPNGAATHVNDKRLHAGRRLERGVRLRSSSYAGTTFQSTGGRLKSGAPKGTRTRREAATHERRRGADGWRRRPLIGGLRRDATPQATQRDHQSSRSKLGGRRSRWRAERDSNP